MAQAQYDFTAFMDAVTNAYGKDVWQGVTTAEDFYSSDFASKITQVDGISATYLKDGSVAYYTYADDVVGVASSSANIINSNTGLSTIKTVAQVPAQTTVSQTTGKVVAESGLKTVSSGSKVTATLGKVATGVMAVGCGVQLGAAIDGALYNANPDFWDSHNMSTLNPQTWDSLVSSQGGKDVFNAVFGIDKDTGETQMYVDQNALAYITQYLVSMGVFNTSDKYEIDAQTESAIGLSNTSEIIPTDISEMSIDNRAGGGYLTTYDFQNYTSPCYAFWYNLTGANTTYAITCSKNPFEINVYRNGNLYRTRTATSVTVNNNTYYYYQLAQAGLDSTYTGNMNYVTENLTAPQLNYLLSYIILYGTLIQGGGVEGITPQQGATLPSGITPEMSTADVIAQLQTLYPDLFTGAIQNDVIQPDGSTESYIYVPCGIPDEIPINETTRAIEPVGGTDLTQGVTTVSETSPESLIETLLNILTTPDPYDPTAEDTDEGTPDTGDGLTPTPIIPTGSVSALYSIYNPSQAELNSFGAWLWSNDFVDQLKKIFNDPMQAIIGLHKIFATPITSGTGTIKVGYLNSNVSANLVSNQYTSIDCGTINLYEYFGNVLDYTQTEIYIYLPFIGIVRLNTDDIMRGAINVVYKVDVLTGACLCTVNVTRDLSGGQLYTYSGNCAVQYPLSSGSYMGIVSGLLGIAGGVVGTIASGGAMLPLALGVGASAIGGMKTRVEHSGSISGNAGAMGIKTPYLIIKRPQTAIADNFRIYDGASQNKYVSIGSLGGYVRAKYVNLENISEATGEELKAIEDELKNGILI